MKLTFSHFFRDTHSNEIDLILRKHRKLIPIEIKSAATFTKDFIKGIERFKKQLEKYANPVMYFIMAQTNLP